MSTPPRRRNGVAVTDSMSRAPTGGRIDTFTAAFRVLSTSGATAPMTGARVRAGCAHRPVRGTDDPEHDRDLAWCA
jgi:hypothetical protein